jgi:MGT family glycosyltransferase
MQAAYLLNLPRVASIATMIMEGVKGVVQPRDLPYLARSALPRLPRLFRLRRRIVRAYGRQVFPRKDIFPCLGQKNVVYSSARFQPPTPFIDDSFTFVGPAIAPASRAGGVFPWERLRAGTRIYVSLGTLHANLALLQTIFSAFAGYPAQFIVSAGQHDLAALGSAPDNFLVLPAVPQQELLARVDLFITHGGNNSVHEALYFGVPLLVVPQQTEQTANGRLVARHGAGIVLGDRPPYGQRVGAPSLRSAVDRLLHDEAYRQAAQILSASLQAAGGPRLAADVVLSV